MLLREIKNIYHGELDDMYPKDEVDSLFNRVIGHYLNLQGFILAFQPNYALTKEEEQPVFEALAQLRQEVPLQYILGETEFMGLRIHVDPSTLIPRPETEELVAWVLENLKENQEGKLILDIGTGSGNIAIAIKKKAARTVVWGMDISKKALELAKKNSQLNGVEVIWIQHDIMDTTRLEQVFDIIVSNPPYVLESEREIMRSNVKDHEPGSALFVPNDDPLCYYKAILDFNKTNLGKGGLVYFEINETMGDALTDLLLKYGYSEIQTKKDIFGKNRMIRATAPTR